MRLSHESHPGWATGLDATRANLSCIAKNAQRKKRQGYLSGTGNEIRDKEEKIMKLYVGNLSFDITEDELATEFGAYGKVESIAIPTDRPSGRPRGFAFVEMAEKSEAEAAIAGLNGKTLKERTIVVNESRPRSDNRGGRSGGDRQRRY